MNKQTFPLAITKQAARIFLVLFATTALGHFAWCQEYKSSVVGTDFDFITADDPSTFESVKFLTLTRSEMPDKRSDDAELFQQAFIFESSFSDETKVKIFIDAKFKNKEDAKVEARRYVDPLGKLPAILRQGVDRLVVHKGGNDTTAFSDVGLIVVYSENATKRIGTHDLEETIFHESVHATWDAKHAKSEGWRRAQDADGAFVTNYAKSKPAREDLAESALFAYTILNHPERIPESDRDALRKTIPHRIAYIGELLEPVTEKDAATDPQSRRPNIVFLLVDDLAWSDLHCFGHAYHRTPNIDRLAADGMRFTNGYAPAPICSASRASILTGKTPARLNFEFVTKNEPGHQKLDVKVPLQTPKLTLNLPTTETTIAERLAPLGYDTAFFGKWHVSQHYQRKYLAWHPDFGPKKQGFVTAIEDFGDHPYAWRKKSVAANLADGEFPDDSMIERTAEFIRDQEDTERPWFLMASSFYVHTPVRNRYRWLVEDYESKLQSNAPNRKRRLEYAAFVETLDHHVGTILDTVDESGQRDDTLILFMSDNGGHPDFCSNAPLRGSKWNLYEGGIRVPMIARWPNSIAAGTTCDTPIIGYDLLPTFVDVAGGELASDKNLLDGVSVRKSFTDSDWQPDRSLIWHFPYYHPEATYSKALDAVGINDFATSKTRPQSAIRDGNMKLIHFAEGDRDELYDLAADISEQHDLSGDRPRVSAELRTRLEKQLESMNARRAVPRR